MSKWGTVQHCTRKTAGGHKAHDHEQQRDFSAGFFRTKPAREQFKLWGLYTVFFYNPLQYGLDHSFSVISVILHCLLGLLLTDSKFCENKYCLHSILRVWHLQIPSFARLASMPATEEKREARAGESGNSLSNTTKLPSPANPFLSENGVKKREE